jgi:heme/copper-type cytochrome/quinol oxidase subunit 2
VKSLCSILLLVLATLAPVKTFACAACYGANIDAPMADGMNWAILTLGVIVTTVLGGFLTFLIYAIRKSEALTAAAEQNTSAQVSNV